ncbi:MAG: polyamine aminopropyltransferase [Arenimonas sp.]
MIAGPNLSARRLAVITLITAAAAIVYELLIGTISTYLNGDSTLQYSLTIGVFLAAMGVGAFLAREIESNLVEKLLFIELALALLGGFSGLLLYSAHFSFMSGYLACMVVLLSAIGGLVGMELPILAELLKQQGGIKSAFASTLSYDYFGSLLGALAFPLILLPSLGTVKTAFIVGMINLVAVTLTVSAADVKHRKKFHAAFVIASALITLGLFYSARSISWFEHRLYQDEIVYAETTRFQRIVITQYDNDLRLYSDQELQFSSRDEYRYHEALIHPALALVQRPGRVLIIGGGDGLATREILKDTRVQSITLVDLDPLMTKISDEMPQIRALNQGALRHPKVDIVNADGYRFLIESKQRFDLIVLDLPDPRTEAIARLYSREFYLLAKKKLSVDGILVTQASSPYYARETFWCINQTLISTSLNTLPYRVNVPSFGEWGFILASRAKLSFDKLNLPLQHQFISVALLQQATVFDADTSAPGNLPVSSLEMPNAWHLYRKRVRYWRN